MHVAIVSTLVGGHLSREEVKHAIDLEDDLALEAEIYVSALEEGLNTKGDFEPAETVEYADVHLTLNIWFDNAIWLGNCLDVVLGVTVFYGGIENGKAVDIGSVGFVELPKEVGQDRRLEFG